MGFKRRQWHLVLIYIFYATCTPDNHDLTRLGSRTKEKFEDSTAGNPNSSPISEEVATGFHGHDSKGVADFTSSDEYLSGLLRKILTPPSADICVKKCSPTVFFVDEFSARLEDDVMPCYVTGCLPLENKQVLVVDKNNMKMKLFDSDFRIVTTIKTPYTTWGITALTRNTFATCGCGDKVIIWKILNNRILKQAEIRVFEEAYGISSNTAYICTLHPGSNALTLINWINQMVMGRVEFPTAFGKPVNFGFDLHMDERQVYVGCAMGDSSILCLDLVGATLLWECPIPGNTCGITEVYNQLLVVDMTKKVIHTVSKGGQYQDQLVSMEYKGNRPQYLGSSVSGRILFVSEYGGDTLSLFSPRVK